MRERGLKSLPIGNDADNHSRSREGAWIEIIYKLSINGTTGGRSREGAWIEIKSLR